MSSYLDSLRKIIAVNELNIGGENTEVEDGDENFTDPEDSPAPAAEESSDEGDENFMDDEEGGDDQPAPEPTEGEDQPAGDDNEEPEGDENFMDGDEGGDDTDTGETPDDAEGDEGSEGDENFMDGDDEGGGDDTAGEEGDGDTSEGEGEEGSNEEGGEDNDYDISAIEDEMFSSLTPEQIAIKNHELKQQFIQLYSMIGSTLVRINDISKSNNNVNTLNFITTKLLELREMIDYNITTAYGTRTYIENQIIYQQCIGTLNALVEIINNIPKLDDINTNDEDDNAASNDNGEPVETDDDGTETLDISDSSMSTYQEESTKVDNDSDFNILL